MRIIRSGVYQIVNEVNGKYYIGSSKDVTNRWAQWRWYIKSDNIRYKTPLVSAFKKYGVENFTFILLEECEPTKEALQSCEQKHIDLLKPAYNLLPTAYSSLGHSMSEETKEKIRAAQKGKKRNPLSAEHREKIRQANIGRKCPITAEHRAKLRLANLGKKHSEAHKANISKGLLAARYKPRQELIDALIARNRARAGEKRKPHSEERKKKIGEANSGHVVTEEMRAKIRESLYKYNQSKNK